MIKDESFSKQSLESLRKRKGYEKSHPEIMEKMIYALYLVEKLVEEDLDFIFKGGTCLSLLIPEIRRFSIDVDIITEVKKEQLENILSGVIAKSRFTRYELDKKRSFINNFPKAHYDIYFVSEFDGAEKNILLDVVFDETSYPEIVNIPIENNLLIIEGNKVSVKIPTIDSLTGDKLTAFAPNTIGIPYNAKKELQIIKQVYDVGSLFNDIKNMNTVANSFRNVSEKQIHYQNLNIKIDDILNDIIDTAFLIGMQNKNKGHAKEKFDEIFKGVRSFPVFLPNPKYNMYNIIEDAAKAALLAAKIKVSNFDALPVINLAEYHPKEFPIIGNKYPNIGKMIKAMPNLSVFYWHHITSII